MDSLPHVVDRAVHAVDGPARHTGWLRGLPGLRAAFGLDLVGQAASTTPCGTPTRRAA